MSEEDLAVVVGSDGVWDMVTAEEVAQAVVTHLEEGKCSGVEVARWLEETAKERWRAKYEDHMDDISCVVCLLFQ